MKASESPKVSVIVPVYNGEQYLSECLESVCKQTYDDLEIIVVNDGSKDASLRICEEFASHDSRIKVIDQKNQGVVIARQVGVSASTGEYLLFLDADDYLKNDCVEQVVRLFRSYNPDIVVFVCFKRIQNEVIPNSVPYEEGLYDRGKIMSDIYPTLIQSNTCRYFSPSVHGKAFRREIYEENQIVNVRVMIGEDMACIVPCIYHANSLYITQENLYYYRINPESVTQSKRVFDWGCAKSIANHLATRIDLSEYDLQMQLDRYVTHMVFITACSQFNSATTYKEVKEDIIQHISDPGYAAAIRRSRFKALSKGWFARVALRYRQVWLMKLYHKYYK